MAKHLLTLKLEDVCIVSPDHGGATRARDLANAMNNAPIAIIDKMRPKPNVASVMNIIGDVKDKNCIIIDDMVDTAGSITAATYALKDAGAKKYMFVVRIHYYLEMR